MKETRDKTRIVGVPNKETGIVRTKNYWPGGQVISDNEVRHSMTRFLAAESIVYSQTNPGPPYQRGGPFKMRRWSLRRYSPTVSYGRSGIAVGNYLSDTQYQNLIWHSGVTAFRGITIPQSTAIAAMKSVSFPTEDLNLIGTKAWNRFSPLKGEASLGQSIIELKREGMPKMIIHGSKRDIRELLKGIQPGVIPKFRWALQAGGVWASEYLNVVFGWRPLLSDISAIIRAFPDLNNRVEQIIRDNNRGVRREGVVSRRNELISESNFTASGNFWPGGVHSVDTSKPIGPNNGQGRVETRLEERVWFSARYRYFLPLQAAENPTFWKTLTKARLLGLDPSPALLWEVMPWSWLIDWFFNVGDVIDRLDGDGIGRLTTDYAYIMRHRKVTRRVLYWTRAARFLSKSPSTYTSIPSKLIWEEEVTETKERESATQFGFGLTYGGLSSGQKWVLAALGQNLINSKLSI